MIHQTEVLSCIHMVAAKKMCLQEFQWWKLLGTLNGGKRSALENNHANTL